MTVLRSSSICLNFVLSPFIWFSIFMTYWKSRWVRRFSTSIDCDMFWTCTIRHCTLARSTTYQFPSVLWHAISLSKPLIHQGKLNQACQSRKIPQCNAAYCSAVTAFSVLQHNSFSWSHIHPALVNVGNSGLGTGDQDVALSLREVSMAGMTSIHLTDSLARNLKLEAALLWTYITFLCFNDHVKGHSSQPGKTRVL